MFRVYYFAISRSVHSRATDALKRAVGSTARRMPCRRAVDLRHRLSTHRSRMRNVERSKTERCLRTGYPLSWLLARCDTSGHAHVTRNASVTSCVSRGLTKNFASPYATLSFSRLSLDKCTFHATVGCASPIDGIVLVTGGFRDTS